MLRLFLFILILISFKGFSQDTENDSKKSFTFKDAVKDPNYLELMQASEEEFQALKKEAQSWPQEKFDKLVDWFVWKVDYHENGGELRRLLIHLRPRAQKRLIEILNDKSHYVKLVKIVETEWLPEAPFHRVCYLFENKPGEQSIDSILKYSTAKLHPIRSATYEILAKIDNERVLPLLKKALTDIDPVAGNMLRELSFRISNKKIPTWEKKLFKPIQDFVNRKADQDDETDPFSDPFAGTDSKQFSIKILFKIDRDASKKIFLTKEYLSLENKSLNTLLEILYDEKIKLDRYYLITLINKLKNKKLEYPETYVLKEAICLLGRHQKESDLQLIFEIFNHKNKDLAEYGAYALLINKNLESFDKKLWEIFDKDGYEKLNKFQKYYYACLSTISDINNGGFDQYFFNSYSNNWKDALEGFKAMEDQERYEILKSAIDKFGEKGPSTDRATRMDQLSEIANKNEKAFDSHDDKWYSCKVPFSVRYAKFVIKNAKYFK